MRVKKVFSLLLVLSLVFLNTNNLSYSEEKTKEQLLKNFKGINPLSLYNALKKRTSNLNKKEFETTSEYNNRIKKINETILIENLKINSNFIFTGLLNENNLDLFYNADKQIMTFYIYFDKPIQLDEKDTKYMSEERTLILEETKKELSSYKASNSFGVKVIVKTTVINKFILLINNWYDFVNQKEGEDPRKSSDLNVIKISVPMKIEKAKELKTKYKNKLKFLVFSNLEKPYTFYNEHFGTPTISNPYDNNFFEYFINTHVHGIQIYNPATGEIFAKTKQIKSNDSIKINDNLFKINSDLGLIEISNIQKDTEFIEDKFIYKTSFDFVIYSDKNINEIELETYNKNSITGYHESIIINNIKKQKKQKITISNEQDNSNFFIESFKVISK